MPWRRWGKLPGTNTGLWEGLAVSHWHGVGQLKSKAHEPS